MSYEQPKLILDGHYERITYVGPDGEESFVSVRGLVQVAEDVVLGLELTDNGGGLVPYLQGQDQEDEATNMAVKSLLGKMISDLKFNEVRTNEKEAVVLLRHCARWIDRVFKTGGFEIDDSEEKLPPVLN